MSEKVQLKGGICEFDFGYNANTAVYTNSSSDIPKLYDILLGRPKVIYICAINELI
jgi:hypothetical protein